MPAASSQSRRVALFLVFAFALICIFYITPIRPSTVGSRSLYTGNTKEHGQKHAPIEDGTLKGHVIMPKLGNETAK